MFDKDMNIVGKHATYWKALCITPGNANDTSTNFKIFDRYIDAYMVAPIVGLLYGRKGTIDPNDTSKDTAGMLLEVQVKNQKNLKYIYRLIQLIDDSEGLTNEEKVNHAFREDADPESVSRGMKLYHSYFLGGIEILYETFVEHCSTDDEYVQQLVDFVKEFHTEHHIDELTDNLEQLLRN